ncbi:hypothetical protein [Streptomyces sp. CB01881]|nr:hypothetical protein [Streptomyces sp. CB01881]
MEAFAVPEEFFVGVAVAPADCLAAYDDPEGPRHRTPPPAGREGC